MKAKDRYTAEGLLAHRQRVQAGANVMAIKRKSEDAKKIAAITRRLKQGTRADVTPFPYFGADYVSTNGGITTGWFGGQIDVVDRIVFAALKKLCGRPAKFLVIDDIA